MLEIGEKAPKFELIGDDDKKHRLSDYKGRWVVLYFYPKDMTPGCTTQACEFGENHQEFENKDAVILGVSADSVESHNKFKDKYSLPFLLLCDPTHETHKDYGAYGEKVLYGRKSIGPIRSTFLIDPKQNIVKIWPRVRVKGHVKKVLDTLKEQK